MLNNVKRRKLSVWFAMLAAAGLAAGLTLSAQAGTARQDPTIRGAGTSMLRGGTGFPDFKPLITKFAFSFSRRRGRLRMPGAGASRAGRETRER